MIFKTTKKVSSNFSLDAAKNIFYRYSNVVEMSWDYASGCNFGEKNIDQYPITFYHQASTHTSSGNSSKNTLETLRAFSILPIHFFS